MTQQELIAALKPLIAATDVSSVVLALARICNENAEEARIYERSRLNERDWNYSATQLDAVVPRLRGC